MVLALCHLHRFFQNEDVCKDEAANLNRFQVFFLIKDGQYLFELIKQF